MLFKIKLTKEQALEKIKHYCRYQERCHSEVKNKLYTYGLWKNEVEEIIAELIEKNFLNEERFAVQFAGGKFRMKNWGRRKIQYELQQKGISSFLMNMAMKQIDEEDYLKTLQKLAHTKWNTLHGENKYVRHSKTNSYLLQKGYEQNLVTQVISEIQ